MSVLKENELKDKIIRICEESSQNNKLLKFTDITRLVNTAPTNDVLTLIEALNNEKLIKIEEYNDDLKNIEIKNNIFDENSLTYKLLNIFNNEEIKSIINNNNLEMNTENLLNYIHEYLLSVILIGKKNDNDDSSDNAIKVFQAISNVATDVANFEGIYIKSMNYNILYLYCIFM